MSSGLDLCCLGLSRLGCRSHSHSRRCLSRSLTLSCLGCFHRLSGRSLSRLSGPMQQPQDSRDFIICLLCAMFALCKPRRRSSWQVELSLSGQDLSSCTADSAPRTDCNRGQPLADADRPRKEEGDRHVPDGGAAALLRVIGVVSEGLSRVAFVFFV